LEEAEAMSEALQNLNLAIEEWRNTRTRPENQPVPVNPYGVKIHAMNMEWAEIKDEHARALDAKRQRYQERVAKLTELSARWKAENPTPTTGRGSRRLVHSDGVKIAAAQALRAGVNKSTVRALLGIADTNRLDTLLAEGEALLNTKQGES
jgi:hypothetical protein